MGLISVIQASEPVSAAPEFESTEIPEQARGAIVGDVRGDGQNRIVIGGASSGNVSVYSWQGGAYVKEWEGEVLAGAEIIPTAIGDADNDGRPEFLAIVFPTPSFWPSNGTIYMYRWNGITYQQVLVQQLAPSAGYMPAAIADLDGDGSNELIIDEGHSLSVYKYSSALGVFELVWRAPGADPMGLLQITAGDVDGDGRSEAIGAFPWAESGKLVVVGYNGTGYAVEATITDFPLPLGGADAVDLDGDGVAEIVTGTFNVLAPKYPVFVVKYIGGNYLVQQVYTSGTGTFHVHHGDIDGDRRPEASVLLNTNRALVVEYDGAYQAYEVPYGGFYASVFGDMADVDSDGYAEIIAASWGGVRIAGVVGTTPRILNLGPIYSLTPDINPVGIPHTVEVNLGTLPPPLPSPLAGIPIVFQVERGPIGSMIIIMSETVLTDDTGKATFTYSNPVEGVDRIKAYIDANRNGQMDTGEPQSTNFTIKAWISNFVTGGGNIQVDKKVAWTFSGTVGVLPEGGSVGKITIIDHDNKITYTLDEFIVLVFSDDPLLTDATSPEASHNTARFRGRGTRSSDGARIEMMVLMQDNAEPGAGDDRIAVEIARVNGAVNVIPLIGRVFVPESFPPPPPPPPQPEYVIISGGNIQVHDLEPLPVPPPPPPPPIVPAAPSALVAVAAGATRVDLAWVDSSNNEFGFRLERATVETFLEGLSVFTLPANITTFSDTTVVPGTRYFYRVLAFNDAGDSSFSNVASVITPAPPPPP